MIDQDELDKRLRKFVREAIAVPFVKKGRDMSGWDCWGEVRCGYKQVLDIDLPDWQDYDSLTAYKHLNDLITGRQKGWIPVERPQLMDVALFNIGSMATHVALIISKREALHTEQRLGTFIERLDSPVWARRLNGIFRHPQASQIICDHAPA